MFTGGFGSTYDMDKITDLLNQVDYYWLRPVRTFDYASLFDVSHTFIVCFSNL
jgi:hypothetical protein